jgi:hypothetical protein
MPSFEHVGDWLKCFLVFVKIKEKARRLMRNSLDLLYRHAGSFVICFGKGGHRFDQKEVHRAPLKQPLHRYPIR